MLLVICALTLLYAAPASAAADGVANRFNVVFVIDGSGSILSTDSDGLRYEAIDLFLGLLPASGNYVGGIVFDDTILEKEDIAYISSIPDKKGISDMFRYTNPDGFTDIGLAVSEAVKMLESGGDSSLPSAIILLSDGNTYLSNKNAYTKSDKLKSDAIKSAQQNGYKVYSVCLNANNKANPSELSEISSATGGKSFEVKSAADLKKVFTEFFSLIYSCTTQNIFDGKLPSSGTLEKSFPVPSVGVKELNILINFDDEPSHISLLQPSGIVMPDAELANLKMQGKTFSVIKIDNPLPGEWKITVNGSANKNINIDLVLNTDIEIVSSIEGEQDSYNLEDKPVLSAQIYSNGSPVTNQEVYLSSTASVVFKKGADITELPMTAVNNGYKSSFSFDSFGSYYATPKIVIDGIEYFGKTFVLNVGNTPPVPKSNTIEQDFTIWPFSNRTVKIDLKENVSDKEDKFLSFWVDSSDLIENTSYELSDGVLTITADGAGSSHFIIMAADSMGLSCSFEVILNSLSSTGIIIKYTSIICAVLIVIAAIILIRKNSLRFDGQITVDSFNNQTGAYEAPQTIEPIKGKCSLKNIISDGNGIAVTKCTFYATGKKQIIFKSREPFYVSGNAKSQKKCVLDGNAEFTISPDNTFDRGIHVTFTPNDYLQ